MDAPSDHTSAVPSSGDGHGSDAAAPRHAAGPSDGSATGAPATGSEPPGDPPVNAPGASLHADRQTSGGQAVSSPISGSQAAGSQNIDKIRDILFGAQMEAYEARFTQLEARIAGEMDTLRGELRRRFATLEGFVRDEVTSLGRRLAEEHAARAEGDETLAETLRARHEALAKRIAEYRAAAAAAERTLRQQLLEQATRAADDLREQTEQTNRTLQQHVADLGHRKTDRAALAALFSELAFRLSGADASDEA